MTEQPLFVLVSIVEDALMGQWAFRAADELAVMRHLLRHPWSYEKVFWGLRISLRTIDQVSPEGLLQAIQDSYSDVHVEATLYLMRLAPDEICHVVEAQPAGFNEGP